MADQMLRRAATAVTEFERNGYVELARAWRRLADEATALERKTGLEPAGEVVPPVETSPHD